MQTWHWAALMGLAFLLGTGLGFVIAPGEVSPHVGGPPDSPPESDSRARGDAPLETEVREEREATRDRPRRADPAPTIRERPASTVPDSELASVLSRIAPEYEVSGDAVLRGRVVDESGAPIVGARVSLIYFPKGGFGTTPRVYSGYERDFWEGLVEDTTRFVAIRRALRDDSREMTTDSDGVFEIRGLADVAYWCVVSHDEYEFLHQRGGRSHSPGDDPLFVGSRVYPVRIRLEEADSETARERHLRVMSLRDNSTVGGASEISSNEWSILLRPGAYQAYVQFLEPAGTTDSEVFIVEEGGGAPDVIIPNNPEWPFEVIVDRGGLASTNYQILCIPDDTGRDPFAVLEDPAVRRIDATRTANGRTTFTALEPGSYVIGVGSDVGYLAGRRVEWTGGGTPFRLEVVAPQAGDCIVCKLEVAGDRGPATPSFQLVQDRKTVAPLTWKAGDGTYRLWVPHSDQIDLDAPARLEARDSSLGTVTLDLTHARPQTLTVRFPETGYLLVEWDDRRLSDSRPYVKLYDGGEEPAHVERRWGRTSVTNGTVVRNVHPGRYRMVVYTGQQVQWPVYASDVDIGVGFNRHAVEVPELTTVTFSLEQGQASMAMLISSFDGKEVKQSIYLRSDHPTSVENLPPGRYRLRYRTRGNADDTEQTFTLPGTKEVVIR